MIGRMSVATVTDDCADSFSGSISAFRENDEIPVGGRSETAEVDTFLDYIDDIDREQRWLARFEASVEDCEHEDDGASLDRAATHRSA